MEDTAYSVFNLSQNIFCMLMLLESYQSKKGEISILGENEKKRYKKILLNKLCQFATYRLYLVGNTD